VQALVDSFKEGGRLKPAFLFEAYLREQDQKQRIVWIVLVDGRPVGYVTLNWKSQYQLFARENMPEIMDLNVLPGFRGAGVGSQLLEAAEKEAATCGNVVGLGVGLYGRPDGGYGSAQKLYVKRGYIPDGKGVTYKGEYATPGEVYPLDDDFIVWFIKKLK